MLVRLSHVGVLGWRVDNVCHLNSRVNLPSFGTS